MVPDGVPGEAVQAELSRFVASLGIDAEQTAQTYDVLVRGLPHPPDPVRLSRAGTFARPHLQLPLAAPSR